MTYAFTYEVTDYVVVFAEPGQILFRVMVQEAVLTLFYDSFGYH